MGASSSRIVITAEQGQMLLKMCLSFGLPKSLGDKLKFEIIDQGQAADQVRALWRELRSRSPLYAKDRRQCFGPGDNWIPAPTKDEPTNMKLKNNDLQVPITIEEDSDAHWGLYWTLLLYLHPASPAYSPAAQQEDVYWPVAKAARLTGKLRRDIGTFNLAAKKLDLDADPDGKVEETADEEMEEARLDPA